MCSGVVSLLPFTTITYSNYDAMCIFKLQVSASPAYTLSTTSILMPFNDIMPDRPVGVVKMIQ
ncbi:uncharacterized protein LACBIDRAFT_299651 [Laccaria bicolor S238N-H82]|uniref:Predicted protein n=1 Tax=Laccaria bicolor (strain S238N-H82 / ATCC MYA-4686) TaxID=486041 RepID=B0DF33_LACBS|nr:uncharacterized protein LACBIDRAFT_299651 [Laccaria bicolor S238N-H82]EDR06649.1 predicted protein [Laccaria bicolor S238N-H82]|eukprot:XP_001882496.1 predicted protein [Laccaria bicolor S238N-H82]